MDHIRQVDNVINNRTKILSARAHFTSSLFPSGKARYYSPDKG